LRVAGFEQPTHGRLTKAAVVLAIEMAAVRGHGRGECHIHNSATKKSNQDPPHIAASAQAKRSRFHFIRTFG
jgi:hypothetical protein